jgi:murein DD-endopeptidase MepM/ murein hydrolase activator NlpD
MRLPYVAGVALIEGRVGLMMTGSVVAANATLFRRVGAAFAALLFLAGPAVAGATREDLSATRASAGDADYHAMFVNWQHADQPQQDAVAIPAGQPVDGANLTSGFGIRTDPFRGRAAMHPGIDLAGPLGTPVYATADGVVDRSEWNNGGYGNLIEIDHGQGIQTRYGHLSQRIAQSGQRVRRGDLIGLMGSTGRSTGSHLHYEVRVAGQAINPIPFVPSQMMTVAMRQQFQTVAEGGPRPASR